MTIQNKLQKKNKFLTKHFLLNRFTKNGNELPNDNIIFDYDIFFLS